MKVIIKGGSEEKNKEIYLFFVDNILRFLKDGLAIEFSSNVVELKIMEEDGIIRSSQDPTAEVIVELSMEIIELAMDLDIPVLCLKKRVGALYDEARAVREIVGLSAPFSVEFYPIKYKPPSCLDS